MGNDEQPPHFTVRHSILAEECNPNPINNKIQLSKYLCICNWTIYWTNVQFLGICPRSCRKH